MDSMTRWERTWRAGRRRARTIMRSPRTVRNQFRWARQRLRDGWDDRALWAIYIHLTRTLGDQLVAMSLNTSSQLVTQRQWKADLMKHGISLQMYAEYADDYFGLEYEGLALVAKEALYWVGDNLGSLWD
jgi:hypothetical protein